MMILTAMVAGSSVLEITVRPNKPVIGNNNTVRFFTMIHSNFSCAPKDTAYQNEIKHVIHIWL